MGMTDKQFNGFISLTLDDILEVLALMKDDSPEKEKLQKLADNLQKMIED